MPELLQVMIRGAIGGLMGFFQAGIIAITAHELGHLVFGKLTGYGFVSFRVSSFIWFKEDGKIKLAKSKSHVAGQCLMDPPATEENFKFVWYNLGGGVFNILLSLIFFVAYVIIWKASEGGVNWFVEIFFTVGFVVNLLIAILNLAPIAWFGQPTDGRNILAALRSKDAKRGFYMMLYINSQLAKGKRYRDFPPELFEVSETANLNNFLAAWLVILEANRLSDMGEHEKAYNEYKRLNTAKLPAAYSLPIKMERLYYHIVHKPDYYRASAIYADKKIKAICTHSKAVDYSWVAVAYEYFVLGNKEKALKKLAQAQKDVENYPNLGERIMYREELERVAGLIDEAENGAAETA